MIQLDSGFQGEHTFSCGQCFRWQATEDGYVGVAADKVCRVKGQTVICRTEDIPFWRSYFCTDMDYTGILAALCRRDQRLAACIAYGSGIRILRQDLWETIVSFIISSNNNIPRIRGIIGTLCRMYGKELTFEGKVYYGFPSPACLAGLAADALAPIRAGYRDKFILDAAHKVTDGIVNLELLPALSTAEARRQLMQICGVGPKVADCILLFALGRFEVFPQDVWIKRILKQVYAVKESEADAFAARQYGAHAGIAQQYLFYYYRDHA